MLFRHKPVLLNEVIEFICPCEGGIFVDATVGLGGHAVKIAESMKGKGLLIGIDLDEKSLDLAAEQLKEYGKMVILRKGNFRDIRDIIESEGIAGVDGVLFDLGLSSYQLDNPERGFSFSRQGPLDMRFNMEGSITAFDIVNMYPEKRIREIIKIYGEEKRASAIAKAIVRGRTAAPIRTTTELSEIIRSAVGRSGRIHPATKTFQALRIFVNDELNNLKKGIEGAVSILRGGGRICVISFHSLEDRIVKNFFKNKASEGVLKIITKKPITPSENELTENPRSRSARLRVAEKIERSKPWQG